jgi:hypothetical protein
VRVLFVGLEDNRWLLLTEPFENVGQRAEARRLYDEYVRTFGKKRAREKVREFLVKKGEGCAPCAKKVAKLKALDQKEGLGALLEGHEKIAHFTPEDLAEIEAAVKEEHDREEPVG